MSCFWERRQEKERGHEAGEASVENQTGGVDSSNPRSNLESCRRATDSAWSRQGGAIRQPPSGIFKTISLTPVPSCSEIPFQSCLFSFHHESEFHLGYLALASSETSLVSHGTPVSGRVNGACSRIARPERNAALG